MKTLFAFCYHWHQKVGLFVALAIIAWGLSGLAHPIMSRITVKPAAFAAPVEPVAIPAAAQTADIRAMISAHPQLQQFDGIRVFQWQGDPIAQIINGTQVDYLNIADGTLMNDGDHQYGEFLARHFSDKKQTAIHSIETITAFDDQYTYINRLLPVLKVQFADEANTTAYIDTRHSRLATLMDDTKVATSLFFRWLHSWSWFPDGAVKLFVMGLLLVLGFLISLAGILVYVVMWRRRALKPSAPIGRRLHRGMSVFSAVAALAFSASGLFHLILNQNNAEHAWQAQTQLPSSGKVSQLLPVNLSQLLDTQPSTPVKDITLVSYLGDLYWRINPLIDRRGAHQHHHNGEHESHAPEPTSEYKAASANPASPAINDHMMATHIAQSLVPELSKTDIKEITLVTQFAGEYGFVRKRLPVYGVHFDNAEQNSVYVEISSQTLSANVNNTDRVEGFSFAYLHKWHFLDGLGKNTRDAILALFACCIALASGIGCWRYWCTRRNRQRREVPNSQQQEA